MEAEQALEADDLHTVKGAQEEAVVPLHHGVPHPSGQNAQPLYGVGAVAFYGGGKHVRRVAGQQDQLSRVRPCGDVRGIGPQGVRRQTQPLLRGAAHIDQRHILREEPGFAVQVRLYDLQRRAAALQIVDVLQIAVQVADLRKQNFRLHCAPSFASSFSFSFSLTRKARGVPSTP